MSRTLPFKLLLSALLLLPAIGSKPRNPIRSHGKPPSRAWAKTYTCSGSRPGSKRPGTYTTRGLTKAAPTDDHLFRIEPGCGADRRHRGTRASPPGPRRAVRHGNRDLCLESRVHPAGTAQKGRRHYAEGYRRMDGLRRRQLSAAEERTRRSRYVEPRQDRQRACPGAEESARTATKA